jgi:hypothetical protein
MQLSSIKPMEKTIQIKHNSSIHGDIVSLSPTLQISIHPSFKVKSLSKTTSTFKHAPGPLLLTKLTMAPASSNPSTTKELATKWLMNPNQREDY